jgi:hypothetical protein
VGLKKAFGLCCRITRLDNLTDLDVADPGRIIRTSLRRRFPNLSRMRMRRELAFSDSISLFGGDNQCELRVSRLRGLGPTQQCIMTSRDFDRSSLLLGAGRFAWKQETETW